MRALLRSSLAIMSLSVSIGVFSTCGNTSPECSTLKPAYSSLTFTAPKTISLSALMKGEPIMIHSSCSLNQARQEYPYAFVVQFPAPSGRLSIPLYREEGATISDTFQFRAMDNLPPFQLETEARIQVGLSVGNPSVYRQEQAIPIQFVP